MRTLTAWPNDDQDSGKSIHVVLRKREVVNVAFASTVPLLSTIAAVTMLPLAGRAFRKTRAENTRRERRR